MTNWDEGEHPRVPEGREAGGQFTAKEVWAGRKKPEGIVKRKIAWLSKQDAERFVDGFEGTAQLYLESALESYHEEGMPEVVGFIDKNGFPLSFYQGGWPEFSGFDDLGDKPYEIYWLGSAGPGGGTLALAEAIKEAATGKATALYLLADSSAVGFYERLGMHKTGLPMEYYFTGEEIKAIAKEFFSRAGTKK